MKKLVLLICFLVLVSPKIYSQLLADDFDYPVGDLAGNGVPPWTAITPSAADLNVVSGSLTFPNYAYGMGIGNSVNILSVSGGEDDTRLLSSAQTTDVYSSFLIQITSVTAGDYFYCLNGLPGGNFSRVYARTAGAGLFNLGIEKSSGTVVYAATAFSIPTTYLVIVKYSFIPGTTNDEMSLFVYAPTDVVPATEPAPLVSIATTALTDPTSLDRVQIRQGTAGTVLLFDGLAVTSSWDNSVLPVELSSFTSVINNRDVTLNWSTSTEVNNSGFDIERSSNGTWSKVGNVSGNGTTNSAMNYSYTDRGLTSGNYSYRLKQIDFNGNFEYFNLSNEVNIGVPAAYELSQNYPNPFNPSTSISFNIPTDGIVSLKLFDMSGKEVSTLVNEVKTAGYYSVNFNAANLTSGIYFYELRADNFSAVKKMMLVK